MSNELEVYEGMKDMVVARPPEQVLAEAKKAATAKNGKTYTVYTIFDENGEKYGTFDTNDTGAIVAIKYVVGKFGNKITGMELSQEQAA